MTTTFNLSGNSNDTNLVLGSTSGQITDGNIPGAAGADGAAGNGIIVPEQFQVQMFLDNQSLGVGPELYIIGNNSADMYMPTRSNQEPSGNFDASNNYGFRLAPTASNGYENNVDLGSAHNWRHNFTSEIVAFDASNSIMDLVWEGPFEFPFPAAAGHPISNAIRGMLGWSSSQAGITFDKEDIKLTFELNSDGVPVYAAGHKVMSYSGEIDAAQIVMMETFAAMGIATDLVAKTMTFAKHFFVQTPNLVVLPKELQNQYLQRGDVGDGFGANNVPKVFVLGLANLMKYDASLNAVDPSFTSYGIWGVSGENPGQLNLAAVNSWTSVGETFEISAVNKVSNRITEIVCPRHFPPMYKMTSKSGMMAGLASSCTLLDASNGLLPGGQAAGMSGRGATGIVSSVAEIRPYLEANGIILPGGTLPLDFSAVEMASIQVKEYELTLTLNNNGGVGLPYITERKVMPMTHIPSSIIPCFKILNLIVPDVRFSNLVSGLNGDDGTGNFIFTPVTQDNLLGVQPFALQSPRIAAPTVYDYSESEPFVNP